MITIASVLRSGGDYNSSHVLRLRESVKAHLSIEHTFVCLSDVDCGVDKIPLTHNWKGWWAKMELFKLDGPVIYLDLDTIIIKQFDDLIPQMLTSKFSILRDVYIGRKDPFSMQSSIMSWPKNMKHLYDVFVENPEKYVSLYRGDQDFIYAQLGKVGGTYYQDVLPNNSIVSYKAHVKGKVVPPETKIVIFHGLPRPWQQTQIPYDDMIYKHGWWVPAIDRECFPIVLKEVDAVDIISTIVESKDTCIQAGGNIGIWPKKLSAIFSKVYTFEPDDDNWNAMCKNLSTVPNVIMKKCALGATPGFVSIDRMNPTNIGAHRVKEGADIQKITIDSLGIESVSLIQFDIEGSEHEAILGSIETIKKWNPLIVLELKGLGKRYGYTDKQTIDLLVSLGYEHVKTIKKDFVFKKSRAPQSYDI